MTVSVNNNHIFIVLENILYDVLWSWNVPNTALCNTVHAKYVHLPKMNLYM